MTGQANPLPRPSRTELSRRLIEASQHSLEQLRYSLSPRSFSHILPQGRACAEPQLQREDSCGVRTASLPDGEAGDKSQSTHGECP